MAGAGIGLAETAESTLVARMLPDHLRGSGFSLLGGVQAAGDLLASSANSSKIAANRRASLSGSSLNTVQPRSSYTAREGIEEIVIEALGFAGVVVTDVGLADNIAGRVVAVGFVVDLGWGYSTDMSPTGDSVDLTAAEPFLAANPSFRKATRAACGSSSASPDGTGSSSFIWTVRVASGASHM